MSRPRTLHPGAWWLWALGLAAAAGRTTNPLLLGTVIAVAAYVVAARAGGTPWSAAFRAFLLLGTVALAVRVLLTVAFGVPVPGHVLVTLPEVTLPGWMAGVRVGGPVTAEALVLTLVLGLQLLAVLACVGAANALADPTRLLKSVPAALYELGVAVVVAFSVTPYAVADARRVRQARRLRGHPDRGLRSLAATLPAVVADALDRSVALAAAMDARGYGRTRVVTASQRRTTGALVLGGLAGVLLGVYGLLDAGSPSGWPVVVTALGVAAATAGFVLAGRRTVRTVYRPGRWQRAEWLVSASGLVPAVVVGGLAAAHDPAVATSLTPLAWPALPVGAALAVLVGLLPARVAPDGRPAAPPARPARSRGEGAEDRQVAA